MFRSQVVAFDRGSTAIRTLWLSGTPGQFEVERVFRFAVGEANTATGEVIAELKAHRVPVRQIVFGAAGQSATFRYHLIPPVPEWRLNMILKYETEEMIEKAGEPLSSDFFALEIVEGQSDDQILLHGLGKERRLGPLIEEIEEVGGRVRAVVPQPLALYHAYRQTLRKPPTETVILADIGASETQLVLAADGRLIFARSDNFGGDQIDEALAAALSVRKTQARQVKEGMEAGRTPPELVEGCERALRSSVGRLLQVFNGSLKLCRALTGNKEIHPDRVLLSGGSARLPKLREFVEDGMRLPVDVFRPPVGGEPLPGDPCEWVIPLGLAASQLTRSPPVLDLLPQSQKSRREFRERTVYLLASAGTLTLALLIAGVYALLANLRVDAARADVSRQEQVVLALKSEEADARRKNQVYRVEIERVRRELEATQFQGLVLDALRHTLPRAIAVEQVAVSRHVDDGIFVVEVRVAGRADNSELTGIEHVEQLRESLKGVPGVVRATASVGVLGDDGAYPFELTLSPHERPEGGPAQRGDAPRGRRERG